MNRLFKELVVQHTPQANPHVMNGLACTYLKDAEAYIHAVFMGANKSFPEGLEYVRCERCTPKEEFEEATRRRTFDLAVSYLYLMKYYFKYNGVELPPRYIYLPFVTDGGIMYIGGGRFHLSPVLADKVISPGPNSIFVRLLRAKINFERCLHSIKIDGVRESVQIVWSSVYRRSAEIKKMPTTTKANTCVVHYLLAKYGFAEMFRKFTGIVPEIGTEEITEAKYPRDQWVIVQSDYQMKPKTFLGDFYTPTKIRLAVPREHWTPFMQSLIAGFYYTVDHFPTQMYAEYIKLDGDAQNERSKWMILLGHIIFSGVYGHGKLFNDIQEHFYSLDEYVDNIIIKKLHELGYDVEDFYELMALILKNFNDWIITASESITSVYGKTMEVLYYVLFDITSAIFLTNFRLKKLATKKPLTPKEIIETMNKQLRTGAIFKLNRSNIAVSTVSYSGDNMYPKITSVVIQQQSVSGATRGPKKRTVVDATKRIHPSMVEVGSMLFLPKSNPTPVVRANMYMNIDLKTGNVLPKPKFEELRSRTELMLKGVLPT